MTVTQSKTRRRQKGFQTGWLQPKKRAENQESSKTQEVDSKDDSGDGMDGNVIRCRSLHFKERIKHFTWIWFTLSMATGGVANVLYSIPGSLRFGALYGLGCAFFLFNIVVFLFDVVMICLRSYHHRRSCRSSFTDPSESLYIPAAIVAFGTLLINITQYGVGHTSGTWLETTMIVFFWLYVALAVVSSVGIYLVMWTTQAFTIDTMTPVWIFPAYPLLITGPYAANLANKISSHDTALQLIVGGVTMQGIGFLVSLMIYSSYLYRLMTQRLPKEASRPGMFISVGPSGFTITGIIMMGQALPDHVSESFMGDGAFAARVSVVLANWLGLWLWGLALWWFFISVGAHYGCFARGKMTFAINYSSYVFPNSALITSTFAISTALGGVRPIQIVGCVMTVGLVIVWFFVFTLLVRAIVRRRALWPPVIEGRHEKGICSICNSDKETVPGHRHASPTPTEPDAEDSDPAAAEKSRSSEKK